ncbi:DUF664 domain-containing protein [Amycolatopsis sp. cg9]|uniref:mycothiol transferase n=1 Tax=Amycolatopsis sp. cg9 TaxID=3238801 RepID=UPI003526A47E
MREVLVGSGTTLLGLVHHLTLAERVWFGHHVAGGEDPGDVDMTVPVEGTAHTLRWVLAHMTSETARHAGHADIRREQLDGVTGR